MRTANIEQKTAAFNKVRMDNQKKTFFWKELEEVLKDGGIPKDITMYANRHNHFNKEVIDGRTIYSFKPNPLHMSEMEIMYKDKKNTKKKWLDSKKEVGQQPVVSEQQAWDKLVETGVIKVKFNINTLKTKYPKVYLDCLEYELNVTK